MKKKFGGTKAGFKLKKLYILCIQSSILTCAEDVRRTPQRIKRVKHIDCFFAPPGTDICCRDEKEKKIDCYRKLPFISKRLTRVIPAHCTNTHTQGTYRTLLQAVQSGVKNTLKREKNKGKETRTASLIVHSVCTVSSESVKTPVIVKLQL